MTLYLGVADLCHWTGIEGVSSGPAEAASTAVLALFIAEPGTGWPGRVNLGMPLDIRSIK